MERQSQDIGRRPSVRQVDPSRMTGDQAEAWKADFLREVYSTIVDPAGWARAVGILSKAMPGLKVTLHLDAVLQVPASTRKGVPAGENNVCPGTLPALPAGNRQAHSVIFARADQQLAGIWIETDETVDDGSLDACMRFFEEIEPHLLHAFELARHNKALLAAQSVDNSPVPAIALSANGHVIKANAAAEKLLGKKSSLMRGADGRLRGVVKKESAALDEALKEAMSTREPSPPITVHDEDDRPLFLSIVPLGEHSRLSAELRPFFGELVLGAVAYVMDARFDRAGVAELLEIGYGLTAAEARLAAAIGDGATLRSYADEKGLSRNTVRNQLSGAMKKLGVSRQPELVAKLARLARLPLGA